MIKPTHVHPRNGKRRSKIEPVHLPRSKDKEKHPAAHAARIFADSANLQQLLPLLESGIIQGVTTNPTLVKQAGATSKAQAKEMMAHIVKAFHPHPVSLELTQVLPGPMLEEAEELVALGENVVVKVPVGGYEALGETLDTFTGLKLIRRLWEKGIKVNATLIFNTLQAFWAAQAGAAYVSPFLGRLADHLYTHNLPERPRGNALYYIEDHKAPQGGADKTHNTEFVAGGGRAKDAGIRLIQELVAVFNNYNIQTEILAASIRNASQVSECLLAGADILTVPTPLLEKVASHPLTTLGMQTFAQDAKAFEG